MVILILRLKPFRFTSLNSWKLPGFGKIFWKTELRLILFPGERIRKQVRKVGNNDWIWR